MEWTAPQSCPSASFKQKGWNNCTIKKFKRLSELEPDGTPVLFVDADVAIFPGLADWCLEWLDSDEGCIGFGDDIVQKCTGVILFDRYDHVLDWFRLCYDFGYAMRQNDQDSMAILESIGSQLNVPLPVDLEKLPGDIVSNWATTGGNGVWAGEEFHIPETTLLWHANWTVGVANKMQMLERVKNCDRLASLR
tara:strand:- start:808 stop:1386 length:579 start_codon:yes stop_codon:yes gene_type:complete